MMIPTESVALIGVVMPALVDLVKRRLPNVKGWVRFMIAFISCTLAGFITTVVDQGSLTGAFSNADQVFFSIVTIFTISHTVYSTFWKPSGISETLVNKD